MEAHFRGDVTGKEMKHLRQFAKNTQIFLVITLLILLYLMDMLHQPRIHLIEKDLEHSLKQWTLKITTLAHQTDLYFSPIILTKQTSRNF